MWPFDSNEKKAKKILSLFQPAFGFFKTWYGLEPSELLSDEYVIGFTFGAATVVAAWELRGKSASVATYDDILLRFYASLVGSQTAAQLLKSAGRGVESTQESPFETGRQRGRKSVYVLLGNLTFEADPDVIQSRREILLARETQKMTGQAPLSDDECASERLFQKYLFDYVKNKSERPNDPFEKLKAQMDRLVSS